MAPGGGGLLQLVAAGAPDVYLFGNTGCAQAANLRDSLAHRWFVGREDGAATAEDLPVQPGGRGARPDLRRWLGDGVLAHVPACAAPTVAPDGSTRPFSVATERAAARIQAAWRRAVADPAFSVCRRRLLAEHAGLLAPA